MDGNCFGVINTEFRGQYSGVSEFEMTPTVDGTGTVNLTFSENINADDFYTVTITMEQETRIVEEMNLSKGLVSYFKRTTTPQVQSQHQGGSLSPLANGKKYTLI